MFITTISLRLLPQLDLFLIEVQAIINVQSSINLWSNKEKEENTVTIAVIVELYNSKFDELFTIEKYH